MTKINLFQSEEFDQFVKIGRNLYLGLSLELFESELFGYEAGAFTGGKSGGEIGKIPFRARVISATNQNLEDSVSRNLFRRDLYYRLNVGYLYIPPLRQRRDEILILSNKLLFEHLSGSKPFQTFKHSDSNGFDSYYPENEVKLPHDGINLENWIDEIVSKALKVNNGNKAKTARFLGISCTSLYPRLKRLKKITPKKRYPCIFGAYNQCKGASGCNG